MVASIISKMVLYYGADVRRVNHALKVYGFASCIARSEQLNPNQILVVDIAAILHDIGIPEAEKKYGSSAGKYQELEGPSVVKTLLKDEDIDTELVDRICYIVGNHHSYHKIDGLDFQVVVEADFLVNIYEDEFTQQMVETARHKHFKTAAGIAMVEHMYLR